MAEKTKDLKTKIKALEKKVMGDMPHNLEAEQALLGCLLLDTKIQVEISANLKAEDFYAESNKLIFTAMLEIIKNNLIGCGLDNFKNVYNQSNGLVFDKVHNVYLQMLITNGNEFTHNSILPLPNLSLKPFFIAKDIKSCFLPFCVVIISTLFPLF